MGNFCSSSVDVMPKPNMGGPSPLSLEKREAKREPVAVPSLLEICLQQLVENLGEPPGSKSEPSLYRRLSVGANQPPPTSTSGVRPARAHTASSLRLPRPSLLSYSNLGLALSYGLGMGSSLLSFGATSMASPTGRQHDGYEAVPTTQHEVQPEVESGDEVKVTYHTSSGMLETKEYKAEKDGKFSDGLDASAFSSLGLERKRVAPKTMGMTATEASILSPHSVSACQGQDDCGHNNSQVQQTHCAECAAACNLCKSSSGTALSQQRKIREIALPEPIVQLIFDRMCQDKLLTASNCTLFTKSHLCSISLANYPEMTDEYFDALFASHHRLIDERLLLQYELKSCDLPSSPLSGAQFPVSQSLTSFDVSGATNITDNALRPLARCVLLKRLNLEGCVKLTDRLMGLILPNLRDLEYFNCSDCREVSDFTLKQLSEKKRLRHIIMDSCAVSDTGLKYLHDMTQLSTFRVARCKKVTADGLSFLERNTELAELSIAWTSVESSVFYRGLKSLRKLVISGTKLGEDGLRQGIQFPQLECVIMDRTKGTDLPLGYLHWNLRVLDASFTSIAASRLTAMLGYLGRLNPPVQNDLQDSQQQGQQQQQQQALAPNLQVLRLESCAVNTVVMAAIGKLTNLTELNIADTEVSNDGMAQIASLAKLTELNCNGCRITNAGLLCLERMTALKTLNMDCPSLSDGCLQHLRNLVNLENLDVFETHVTDTGVDSLLHLQHLKGLQICCGKLTNTGLAKLSNLTSLTNLNLSQNQHITDGGLASLASLQSLTHVNLSGTQATPKGLAFVSGMPKLRTVGLFGCKAIKVSALKQLKDLPPHVMLGHEVLTSASP